MSYSLKAMFAAGALLALGTFATPASAQHVCQGDAYRFCNEFIPDRAKVASCLFKNRRGLSPQCRAEIGGGRATVSRKAKGKRHGKRSKKRR
jgi:hypothetical protein